MRGNCETMSSMSETSTSTSRSCYSSDAREELNDFASSLGLSTEQLYKDRFRVDRKKLELMLLGNSEIAKSAHDFFQKIMNDTKTLILWPSRLKIGAKSKKDPHIKIAGTVENVNTAKHKVMNALDSRSNRVTMKVDVSYTDHSHIIGKGGLRIRRVMEETSCHIHFPDSNRSNQEEKSNQVSIAGEMSAIEKARSRVRELTPLIFCFELPNMGTMQSFPELTSPYIVSVQETYNVQVMFRTRAKLHSTLVMVKGCEWEVSRVKEATLQLINHMCDAYANQVMVQMMMEISPQYHSIVLGANHQNLKSIMQQTGVQVMFPDASDPNTPSIKKSSVVITGLIHNVYLARQLLLGSLPLVLMFDLMPEAVSLNAGYLDELMQTLDVYISIRHKPKQNIYSVVIKGLERNAANIYEARQKLFGSVEKPIAADIPDNYKLSGVPTFLASFSASNALPSVPNYYADNGLRNGFGFGSPQSPAIYNRLISEIAAMESPQRNVQQVAAAAAAMFQQFPLHHRPGINNNHMAQAHIINKMAYNSVFTENNKDAAQYSTMSSTTSSLSSPNTSPRNCSPSHLLAGADLSDAPERKAPGYERSLAMHNYDRLRVTAAQAMQGTPKKNETRVPTQTWSGYGFSQSSPGSLLSDLTDLNMENNADVTLKNADKSPMSDEEMRVANAAGFSASNYLDSKGNSVPIFSTFPDLASYLASLGLQKYIQLFKSHEIDITTFQTLTDLDLREIGVSAFGARRKMILLIAELRKRDNIWFKSSQAAVVASSAEQQTTP